MRTNVQTTAPETQRIFDEYAKELAFRKALTAASKKLQKQSFSLADAAAVVSGGIPGLVAEKAVTAPAAKIGVAKVIRGTAKIAKKPAIKAARGLANKLITKSATNSGQR